MLRHGWDSNVSHSCGVLSSSECLKKSFETHSSVAVLYSNEDQFIHLIIIMKVDLPGVGILLDLDREQGQHFRRRAARGPSSTRPSIPGGTFLRSICGVEVIR